MRRATDCVTKNTESRLVAMICAPVGLRKIHERRALGHAGIVHQDVDRPDVLLDLARPRLRPRPCRSHRTAPRPRSRPIAFTVARHGRASRPLMIDARARRHVAFRDGAADAAARAGDEREAAGEIEHACSWGFLDAGGQARPTIEV